MESAFTITVLARSLSQLLHSKTSGEDVLRPLFEEVQVLISTENPVRLMFSVFPIFEVLYFQSKFDFSEKLPKLLLTTHPDSESPLFGFEECTANMVTVMMDLALKGF